MHAHKMQALKLKNIALKLKKKLKSPKEVYQHVHSISQNHLQPVILGYKT